MSLTDALLLESYAQAQDVWIALRTDGAKGSGTEDDPYDGGTRSEAAVTITGLSYSPGTPNAREATVTTATDSGYANGDMITISGVTGPGAAQFNGTFPISGKSGTTFQYWMSAAPGGAAQGTNWTAERQVFRFDDLMNNTVGANAAVHLGPGIFQTRGMLYWQPRTGQKLRGSGIAVTTVKLVGVTTTYRQIWAIGGIYDTYLDSFEASDFTVDCNISGQIVKDTYQNFPLAPVNCGGIDVVGKHIRLRRIRAINFGTQGPFGASTPDQNDPNEKPSYECFALAAGGAHPDLEKVGKAVFDCVIEDCIVEQPSFNNSRETTCILTAGTEPGGTGWMAYARGCVVRNCVVNCEYRDNPVAISQLTNVGKVATVITLLPHGRSGGDWARISGALVNGSTNNPFNGAFQVISDPPPTSTQFQYTMDSTPSGGPSSESDLWVGRWPSLYVAVTTITKGAPPPPGQPWVFTVTTGTPHFLAQGGAAVLSNVTNSDPNKRPNAFNVTWIVSEIVDRTHFKFEASSDPGSPLAVGNSILGVNFQAVGIAGTSEAVMEGCQVFNCGYGGPYQDTWSTKDVIVRNNHYRAIFIGPYNYMGGVGHPIPAASLDHSGADGKTATFAISQPPGDVIPLPHAFTLGQAVRITAYKLKNGSPIPANTYNGVFAIKSLPSEQSFTYTMLNNPGDDVDVGTTPPPTVEVLWQVGQCVIENNVIELIPHFNNYGPPRGIGLSGAYWYSSFNGFPIFRRVVIRNNVIRYVDNLAEATPQNLGINFGSCEDVLVENNVIDLLTTSPIAYGGCTSVRCFNNRDSSGKLIQGVVGTAKQDELTTFIEDAAILSIL